MKKLPLSKAIKAISMYAIPDDLDEITKDFNDLSLKQKIKTGLIYDDKMLLHKEDHHPECPERFVVNGKNY